MTPDTRWKYMKDSELSKTDDMREWGKPQWTNTEGLKR